MCQSYVRFDKWEFLINSIGRGVPTPTNSRKHQEFPAMIYLYVKSHNVTGLKYFGKTTKPDPHRYKGSGKYWKNHIAKYGYNVTTEIVAQFDLPEEASNFALDFSKTYNIVESDEWANLKHENGLDGSPPGVVFSEEHRERIRQSRIGKCFNDFDDITRQRMSEASRLRELAKVKEGKSTFQGQTGSEIASRRNARLVAQGKHNFLGCGKEVSERNKQKIREGTFHTLGKLLCVDINGQQCYIATEVYHKQEGPVEHRAFVHVASREAKRRKQSAMEGKCND